MSLAEEVAELLYREAACIDSRRWDDWLALYLPESVFWVPMWVEQDRVTRDPEAELSHIYIGTRAGLEDRVWRVRSGRSIASQLMPRTTHQVSNVRVLGEEGGSLRCAAAFSVFIYDLRTLRSSVNFGHYEYRLRREDGELRITAKTATLDNDLIDSVVDFYLV